MKLLLNLALGLLSIGLSPRVPALEAVSFSTNDGATIHADYYPGDSAAAVVLAHGAAFDKSGWRELAEKLAARKIGVLAIDFRGYGKSKGGNNAYDRFEDILAAVRYLYREINIKKVSVLGASMGGGAAATAAVHAEYGNISRLLLLSPVPIANPEKIRAGKILYVASAKEGGIESIKAQYDRAPNPKQLILIKGRAHAQHIFNTEEKTALTDAIIQFLQE